MPALSGALGGVALSIALAIPAAAAAGTDARTGDEPTGPSFGSAQRHRPLLTGPQRGRDALAALGAAAESIAAARNNTSVARLRALVTHDPSAWLGRDGRLFYVEHEDASAVVAANTTAALDAPSWATHPLADSLTLHSKPGSQHTVYLDFTGYTLGGTGYWATNGGIPAGTYDGFSLDGTMSTAYTDDELTYIQTVWRMIAEKYSPFDVDVTTEAPASSDAVNRSSAGDQTWGTQVVITNDMDARGTACTATPSSGCVGIALVDVFDEIGETGSFTDYLEPAWVYTKFTTGSAVMNAGQIANAAAHEIGHTLGLYHDRTSSTSYYAGHDDWFAIMGSSDLAVGQFNNGGYTGAVTDQIDPLSGNPNPDDLDVIEKGGAPRRADDVSGTSALGSATSYAVDGIVERSSDTDTFSVDRTCTGALTASATGIGMGQMLDLKLTVRDPGGIVQATADPATTADYTTHPDTPLGMDASATVASADTGLWTITVEGTGLAGATGYPDYGSIGQYHLDITGCAGVPAGNPPDAPGSVSATPNPNTATAALSWTEPASPDAPISGYKIVVRQGVTPLTTINAAASPLNRTLTGLTPGVTYSVDVIAQNTYGDSGASADTVRIATWAPTTPPDPAVTVTGTGAVITWTTPANPGQATLTGWRVRILRAGTQVFDQSSGSDPQPLVGSRLSAANYSVLVTASYLAEGVPSSVTGSQAFSVVTKPSAPRIGTASSGRAGKPVTATARWSAPSSAGNSAITGYRVKAYKLNARGQISRTFTSSLRPAGARSFVYRLPAGRYKFKVIAYNGAGASGPSSYSRIVTAR